MMIENATAKNVQNPAPGLVGTSSAPSAVAAPSAVSPAPAQGTSVTLSGQAIMLARLFNITDPSAMPPVLSGVNGMDQNHIGLSPVNFLTQSDRSLVSNMYGYAKQQGADLRYVDDIASELGNYRQHNDGRMTGNFNSGNNFDLAGHQMTVNFNAQDSTTAASILNGNAINSTQIDQGFLRYTLDPGLGALSDIGSMQFLQQMVTKFSDEGNANMMLDPKFSTYIPVSINDKVVFTASKEILNPYPAATFVADYTSINGVGHWRTPELEAAAKHGGSGTGKSSGIDLIQYLAAEPTQIQSGLLDNNKKNKHTG
jgi:hypothetical protein